MESNTEVYRRCVVRRKKYHPVLHRRRDLRMARAKYLRLLSSFTRYGNLLTANLWILKRELPEFEHLSWINDVLTDQRRSWHVFTVQKDRQIKRFWHENQKGETATVRLKKNNPRPVVAIHLELATNAETKKQMKKEVIGKQSHQTKPHEPSSKRWNKIFVRFQRFSWRASPAPYKIEFLQEDSFTTRCIT